MSILQLKEWMGHSDIDTTMKYLHFAPRAGDAELVAQAFGSAPSAWLDVRTHADAVAER